MKMRRCMADQAFKLPGSFSLVAELFHETREGDFILPDDVDNAIRNLIELERFCIVITSDDDVVEGMAVFYIAPGSHYMDLLVCEDFIFVRPQYRNSTRFLRLFKELIRCAKYLCADRVVISSINKNPVLQGKYLRMLHGAGFTHLSVSLQLKL